MRTEEFCLRVRLPFSAETVFDWHARLGAFTRLSPPWESVKLVVDGGPLCDGSRAEISVPFGPFRKKWIAEHRNVQPGRQFQDVQISGPFAHWVHTHRMTPDGQDACILEDRIEYALPLGSLSRLLAGAFVRNKLQRLFAYRHATTRNDLQAHFGTKESPSMKVLVSGASGLVGSALVAFLATGGHQVSRLVRRGPAAEDEIRWDPSGGTLDKQRIHGFDAVVHLAGENIASGRWNDSRKKRILDSRVESTRLLCETLAELDDRPQVFVCASAIGIYGHRGDEELTEESAPGDGFLPEVCQAWEDACEPVRAKGIRVVNLRTGVVLTPAGGALQKMLLPFKLGLGGIVGNGKQYWSWISLDDLIGVIHHAITHDDLDGPVNGVVPHPATNREFTKTLGKVLRRPTIFPMPAFAARIALGEMADALLLASARVAPTRLQSSGYEFRTPDLEDALRHLLGR